MKNRYSIACNSVTIDDSNLELNNANDCLTYIRERLKIETNVRYEVYDQDKLIIVFDDSK